MKSRRAASNVCVCCPASVWHRRLRGVEVVGALRGPARGEGCTRHRAPAIGSFALPRRPPLPRSPPLTDHIPPRRRRATPSSPPPLSLSLSFVVPGMTPAAALLPHTPRCLNTHLSHIHPHPTRDAARPRRLTKTCSSGMRRSSGPTRARGRGGSTPSASPSPTST